MLENFMNYIKKMKMKDSTINVEKEEIEKALSGEEVPQKITGFSSITVELLKLFTSDKKYYKDFYNQLVEKNNTTITLRTTDEVGFNKDYDYNKFILIGALEWANDNDKLNKEEIELLKLLKMSVEFNRFIEKYSDADSFAFIEGKYVTLPVKEFITVMTTSDIESIIESGKYGDLSLDEFVYALDVFLDENKILDKFYIPKEVSFNLNRLREATDITYINRCLDVGYDYLRKVEINPAFYDEVLKNMSPDFDDLEKSFYIYYKMCTLLTYDEEQYARRENKDYEIKHRDFSRLKDINSKNNRIVCYEFNSIYANFLRNLGIKYELEGDYNYGSGHACLTFRVGNFIVRADSTVGLIKSDLSYAKNGLILTGFTLENTNKSTYDKFIRKLDNVYDYIVLTEPNKFIGTCRDLKYQMKYIPTNLSLAEKSKVFIKMSNDSTLPTIDKIPYEIKIRKLLFHQENFLFNKFNINYISNRENCLNEKYTTMKILTFNENGVGDVPNNTYISMNSNGAVDYLNYDEIKYKLRNGTFRGAMNDTRTIPGFNLEQMKGNKLY